MTPSRATALPPKPPAPSTLMLCDQLLTLAKDADRAGLTRTASRLVGLAHKVFEEPAARA